MKELSDNYSLFVFDISQVSTRRESCKETHSDCKGLVKVKMLRFEESADVGHDSCLDAD